MSALKSFLGNIGILAKQQEEAEQDKDAPAERRAPAVDIVFDSTIRQEAILQQLWKQYQMAGQQSPQKEIQALKTFCKEFEHTFADWKPDESIFNGTRSGALQHGKSVQGLGPGWVKGCHGGHPKAVLSVLCSTLSSPPTSPKRKAESAKAEGTPFWVMEALSMVTRSYHNCEILLEMGLLTTIALHLKTAVSRLTTIATQYQNSASPNKSQLGGVQHSLSQLLEVLLQWTGTEVRKCRTEKSSPLMRSYVQGEVQFLSLRPTEAGSRADSKILQEALHPVLESGLHQQVLDIFKLVTRLKSFGAHINIRAETRLLEFLSVVISASPAVAASVRNENPRECSLRAMIQSIGSSDLLHVDASDPSSDSKAQEIIRSQILLLQVVAAAVKHNSENLEVFHSVGGHERCAKLACWISQNARQQSSGAKEWPQPPTWFGSRSRSQTLTEAEERSGLVASTSGRGYQKQSSMRRSNSTRRKSVRFSDDLENTEVPTEGKEDAGDEAPGMLGGFIDPPRCQALKELFWVLESMLSLKGGRRNSVKARDLCSRLGHNILAAFIQKLPSLISDSMDREGPSTLLQLYVIQFLFTVLRTHPEELERLRELGYLDLLFSPAFFMMEGHSRGSQERILLMAQTLKGHSQEVSDPLPSPGMLEDSDSEEAQGLPDPCLTEDDSSPTEAAPRGAASSSNPQEVPSASTPEGGSITSTPGELTPALSPEEASAAPSPTGDPTATNPEQSPPASTPDEDNTVSLPKIPGEEAKAAIRQKGEDDRRLSSVDSPVSAQDEISSAQQTHPTPSAADGAPAPSSPSADTKGVTAQTAAGALLEEGNPSVLREIQLLRLSVLQLVYHAACIENSDGCLQECRKMIEVLAEGKDAPEVVCVIATCLTKILEVKRDFALTAFKSADMLLTIAKVITAQQQFEIVVHEASQDLSELSADRLLNLDEYTSLGEARRSVLQLLMVYLSASPSVQRQAVHTWDIVTALFSLTHHKSTRTTALRLIVELMKMVSENEDDSLAKVALFTKFMELLPAALQSQQPSLPLVRDLLRSMREVLTVKQTSHQTLFRNAECFLQLLHLLNLEYPAKEGEELCCEVLATLTALLCNNEASRSRLQAVVGYDTLESIILKLVEPRGPSEQLLLHLLGLVLEEEYRFELPNQKISNVYAVPLMFHCIRQSERANQLRMLSIWQRLVGGSMANLSACERAGLNTLLIDWTASTQADKALQLDIVRLLRLTGSYSISAKDLLSLLGLLQPAESRQLPGHYLMLLKSLSIMAQHEGPAAFFDFADDNAGLIRTIPLKLPTSRGYTFATWLRLEKITFRTSTAGQSLFCFLSSSGEGHGVVTAIQGDKIQIFCKTQKVVADVEFDYAFEAKKWYHIVLTHRASGAVHPSTVRLFVNGNQVSSHRFKYPKANEAFEECSFGARLSAQESKIGKPVAPFNGQLGCIYLFEDVFTPGKAKALFELGPDYQSTFLQTESDPAFDQAASATEILIHGKQAVTSHLILSYNAQAAAGRMLYETSGMDRGSDELGTAAMMEGTRLCCTCQLGEILHCLGGVPVLLPLLSHLDLPMDGESADGANEAVQIVQLLASTLDGSPSNRQTFLQVSGMGIMTHLLSKSQSKHLTVELLGAVEKLCHAVRPSEKLWLEAMYSLMLNFRLWSRSDVMTQRTYMRTLVKYAKECPRVFSQLVGVPGLLDTVKALYWTQAGADAEKSPAGGGKLSEAEIIEIRRSLLHISRILMQSSILNGTWRSERSWADVQAFVSFVGDCPEVAMLEDVLSTLYQSLHHGSASHFQIQACIQSHGGERLFVSLLQKEEQSLRLLGLQLITAFQGPRQHTGADKDQPGLDDMKRSGFWATVYDLLSMFPYNKAERVMLLEMLCVGTPPVQARGRKGGPAVPSIGSPPVAIILLRLIKHCDDPAEISATLEALQYLIVQGPEVNRAGIVQLNDWQGPLLELLLDDSPLWADRSRQTSKGSLKPSRSIEKDRAKTWAADELWSWEGREVGLVQAILKALFVHCISHSENGWSTLEQIACFLRKQQDNGRVNGRGLMIALMTDVIQGVLGSNDGTARGNRPASPNSSSEAWSIVSIFSSNPARRNAIHLVALMNQIMAGVLIQPEDQETRPALQAVQWAEAGNEAPTPGHIWQTLGFEAKGVPKQLRDAAWQLLLSLHKSMDTPTSQELPAESWLSRTLPAAATLSLPLGLEKHLSPLPFPRLSETENRRQAEDESKEKFKLESVRLVAYLLFHSLSQDIHDRAAAESLFQDANQLLSHSLDPQIDSVRQNLGVLVGVLLYLIESLPENDMKKKLTSKFVSVALKCARPIFEADSVPAACLPDLGDPSFQVGLHEVKKMLQVSKAVHAEVLHQSGIAVSHIAQQNLTEASRSSQAAKERQLRQNLQEDARSVLSLIHSSERNRRGAARNRSREEAHSLARAWRNMQRSLYSTGGLWAAPEKHTDLHWKLDKIEDPMRRRMRLKQNFKFEEYKQVVKGSPKLQPTTQQPIIVPGLKVRSPSDPVLEGAEDLASPSTGQNAESAQAESSLAESSLASARSGSARPLAPADEIELETSESADLDSKVLYSTACKLVTAKNVTEGQMNITASHITFFSQPPAASTPRAKANQTVYKKWFIEAIAEIHHARFLLRPFALELFLASSFTALLSFESAKVAKDVARQLQSLNSQIIIYDKRQKVDLALKLQARWLKWQISNFEYIMELNTLAGRTYNDLNQYPVFPWTIADYKSDTLDLNDPATYRDFSKPVGALNEKRLAGFKERYASLKSDPETPAFHYGTHYSSAAIVLYYLIRMEPFTMLNRNLQGGRFDHADRLFGSISETWENSLQHTADVKELIPEFYYQPEFLLNSNKFDLGARQDGVSIQDVKLPAWANGSADEFVRLNREALESEYVSEHLHEWLDLIFGVTQSGPAAETACNVFYYLTYEGAVDLDVISDPVQRKAVEDQISLFGQTPSQLFRRKHPKRGPPPAPSLNPLLNGPDTMKLTVVGKPPVKRPDIAVAELCLSGGRVILINADRMVSCHRWLSPRDLPAFTFTGVSEATFTVEADPSSPRLLGMPFAADFDRSKCFCVLPGGQIVLCCGYWDNSIRAYGVDDGLLLQAAKQHKDIVTCIATSPNGAYLISGSRDTTVIVWEVCTTSRAAKGRGKTQPTLPLNQVPLHILSGHSDAVVCVAASSDLDIVVSSSATGEILLHQLGTGRLVRSLRLPEGVAGDLMAIAPQSGTLVVSSSQNLSLHTCTINARQLESCSSTEKVLSMAVSPDGRFVLTGGSKGLISLRYLHSLQVMLRYDPAKGPITALAMTPEECILGGTQDGSLLVLAPDPRRTIRKRYDYGEAKTSGRSNLNVPTLKFDKEPIST